MTPAQVIALIGSTINTNGRNAITGSILNNVLIQMTNMQRGIGITCGSGGYIVSTDEEGRSVLTGPFLSNALNKIYAFGGVYIIGNDFIQNTISQTLTWTNGQVFSGSLYVEV